MKRVIRFSVDLIWYFAGCFIYSAAVTIFVTPNEISPGGITGIATLIQYLFNIPSGFAVLLLNLPILILGFIKFGGIFIIKTFIATFFLSFTLTLTDLILPSAQIDRILASIFGGLLMGIGVSLVIHHGATTGGVDILAKLINKRFAHITVGNIILVFDGIVIALAAFIYRNFESALYSATALYVSSKIMDTILYGADKGKIIHIISSCPQKIADEISTVIGRGVTLIAAKGGYTGNNYDMIMCTVRRHEVSEVYRIIKECDPKAFTVVGDAGEIIGEGFKAIEHK